MGLGRQPCQPSHDDVNDDVDDDVDVGDYEDMMLVHLVLVELLLPLFEHHAGDEELAELGFLV